MNQQKNFRIKQLNVKFNLLRSIIDNPRLFIAEQIGELKDLIDTECEKFLAVHGYDPRAEDYRIVLERQTQQISEIEAFEKSCLPSSNQTVDEYRDVVQYLERQLKIIDDKTNDAELNGLDEQIQLNLSSIEKKLFCNRSVLFFSSGADFVKKLAMEKGFANAVRLMSFGLLEIVEDEYINQRKLYEKWHNDSNDGVYSEQSLLSHLVKQVFYGRIFNLVWATHCKESVNRTTLATNRMKKLDLSDSIQNKQIDCNAFRGMKNLECLSLSNNDLRIIDKGTFTNFSSLKVLKLSRNRLINLEVLSDLCSLVDLNLSRNQLELLDPHVFKSLVNLRNLNLSRNCLRSFKPETFSELSELEVLELAYNQISDIDLTTFKGLGRLSTLDLGNNRISELNPRVFDELVSLNQLSLVNNLLEIDDSFKTNMLRKNDVYIHR